MAGTITYPFRDHQLDTMDIKMVDFKEEEVVQREQKERGIITRMLHSFKRQEPKSTVAIDLDPESSIPRAGDTSQLHRKLKGRHIQMIAIGGAIGAGLFIGSGKALANGGPGAVVLDFGLIGFMLFCTVNALGELATLFPVQGTFIYTTQLTQARSPSSPPDSSIQPGVLQWVGIMQWVG